MYLPAFKPGLSAIFALVFLTPLLAFGQEKPAEVAAPAGDERAISYGFVIDNSGSFRLILEKVIVFVTAAAKENRPDDEAFLTRFISVDKVTLEQDLTGSKAELIDAAESMYIEGGQAALLDAIGFSAKHLAENARAGDKRTRWLLVITDGDDRGSVAKIEPTIRQLKENNIRIAAVAVSDDKVQTKTLERIARESGGRLFVMKSPAQLPAAAGDVAAFMRKP